jgi:hypothetical protein
MIFDAMHRNGEPASPLRQPIRHLHRQKNFRVPPVHWENTKNINKNN